MQTLVVVPTYNEAATVGTVIDRIDELGYDLLVVDDGSPDGTAELVEDAADDRPGIHLLRRTSKDGLGSAYRAGFAWALEQDRYDVVCQMDADLSHEPFDLQHLVAAVADGADVAIGSRYVAGGSTPGWSRSRRWLSRGGNTYMRVVTGVGVKDMTAGFRAWRSDALEQLGLCQTESEGYSFQLETTALAWTQDKRVAEVPIAFSDRVEGDSKMSSAIILEALWRVLILGWRIRRPASIQPGGPQHESTANEQRAAQHEPQPAAHARPGGDQEPVGVDGADGPDLVIDLRDNAAAHRAPADPETQRPVHARPDHRN
jgi:dolichol-phosphate mannosyltransferase